MPAPKTKIAPKSTESQPSTDEGGPVPPFHLLPLNLGRVAEIADRDNSTRFALSGVHVVLNPDNTYVVEATDSKSFVRVTGPCNGSADEYPSGAIPQLEAAGNRRADALLPGDQWKEIFARATKLTRKSIKPILKSVAVKIGPNAATLAMTNIEQSPCESVRLVEGRFPPTDHILGQSEKDGKPLFSVNAKRLKELLQVLIAFSGGDAADYRVDFSSAGLGKPILIKTRNGEGQEAVGIVMPLEG